MTWPKAIERFKIGKIYHDVTLKNVEKINPGIAQIGRDWVKNPEILYISGSPGSGKTYFLFSILRGLIQTRKPEWIIFKKSDDLDTELLRAIEEKQEAWHMENYHNVPYLFIDDLGVERINERIIKQYYNIIDRRTENMLPTVITSNVSCCDIHKTLGDRIASRLEIATEIKFPNRDLRKN